MAISSAMFQLGVKKMMDADIDLLVHTIKVCLVNGYTVSQADEFLSDMSPANLVGESGASPMTAASSGATIGTPTTNSPVGGVFDAADTTMTAVSNGAVLCDGLVIYRQVTAGGLTHSPVICIIPT